MANEKRLIDASALLAKNKEAYETSEENPAGNFISTILFHSLNKMIDDAPTVDAVEVESLRAWLYEIAMNNTDNPLSEACEEIISRLDGLRAFARERKDHDKD